MDPVPLPPSATGGASGRIAGLDGIRAIAVGSVLVYHLWPSVLPAGFVGVTVFFALSGFLITSLLVGELEQSGTVRLGEFYRRRVRRLLPASLATLAIVAVVWRLAGWMTAANAREIVAAALQVSNWQQIIDGRQYGVDADASPVLHFWSLAVEEQVYLVLPLLVLAGRSRRGVAAILLAVLCAVVAAQALVAGDPSTVYFATYIRAGEIAAGALLAVVLHRSRSAARPPGRISRIAATAASIAGLAALVAVAARSSLSSPAYSNGGLLACGVLAAVTIAAVTRSPAVASAIDAAPMRWIGERAYGLYLVHWPLLLAFERTELDSSLVPWVTLAATLGLSALSYSHLEMPIRSLGRVGWRFVGVVAVAAVVVAASTATAPVGDEIDFEELAAEFEDAVEQSTASTAPDETRPEIEVGPATAPSIKLGIFGDSKVLTLGLGLAYRGPYIRYGTSLTGLGCPIARAERLRNDASSAASLLGDECDWSTAIAEAGEGRPPIDVALVWTGTWDIRQLQVAEFGDRWLSIDDPEGRDWLLAEMIAYADEIVRVTGASRVLWLTVYPADDYPYPERYAAYNQLVSDVASARPFVEVVDLAGWVASTGEADRLLPDGIHPSFDLKGGPNSAAEIGRRWLTAIILGEA
ncbi:MAG: hypothetical protein RJB61_2581 [Actinomycetota bacterium]